MTGRKGIEQEILKGPDKNDTRNQNEKEEKLILACTISREMISAKEVRTNKAKFSIKHFHEKQYDIS